MSFPNMKTDRSEKVIYDRADYPAYIRKGRLSSYPQFAAESYWHDDVEFILIISAGSDVIDDAFFPGFL